MNPAVLAFDRATVRTVDQDGRLHVALTNISKANVCPYLGSEIPNADALGLQPDKVYNLFRDPAELEKAAPTFNNIPVLSQHVPVYATDPRPEIVVGSTGTNAAFEHPYLKNSLVVWVAEAIDGIENGAQCELSCAYRYTADMTPGVNDGMRYDGVMRDILGNHVALVKIGRAGPDVVVGDSFMEVLPMKRLSRVACVTKGALAAFLRPMLAADAAIDLGPVVADLNKDNFKTSTIADAVKKLTTGKLAKDADLAGIHGLLDSLDKDDDAAMDDGEWSDEDESSYQAMVKRRKAPAMDADDDDDKDDDKAKAAMDAAITKAKGETETSVIARMNSIRQAEREVRPFVGDLVMSLDSADAVYKLALDARKIDLTGVAPSAYGPMVRMLPVSAPAVKKTVIATDAAVINEVAEFLKKD